MKLLILLTPLRVKHAVSNWSAHYFKASIYLVPPRGRFVLSRNESG